MWYRYRDGYEMEINSLLCGVSEADLHSVVHPDQSGLLWLPGTGCTAALSGVSVGGVVPAPHLEWWQQRQDAPSTLVCCVVRGSDIADLPTEYMVTDLLLHEHPVIGECPLRCACLPACERHVTPLQRCVYSHFRRPDTLYCTSITAIHAVLQGRSDGHQSSKFRVCSTGAYINIVCVRTGLVSLQEISS